MKFYIFVLGLLFNLSYCFPTKAQRNDHVNQQTWSVPTSLSNKGSTSKMDSVEILVTPYKLEYDKKSYRLIRLGNGLTALLVSTQKDLLDEKKDGKRSDATKNVTSPRKKAACSLTVDVGSFSDPRDVQGLAHFVGEFDVSAIIKFTLRFHILLVF